MKNFEQLNDAELVALNDEQISDYIKLKKAEQGIKILQCPEYPTLRALPEADTIVYTVASMSFLDKEPAEEICEIINKHAHKQRDVSYEWGISRDVKYEKPKSYNNLESVSVEKVFSQETYNEIKDVIKSNEMIKKSYESVLKEYKDEEEKATELIDSIYETIQKAKDRIAQFKEYKVRIVDYVKLANGVVDIAWNFFDKAYAVEPSVKNMIMESNEYKEAVASYVNA